MRGQGGGVFFGSRWPLVSGVPSAPQLGSGTDAGMSYFKAGKSQEVCTLPEELTRKLRKAVEVQIAGGRGLDILEVLGVSSTSLLWEILNGRTNHQRANPSYVMKKRGAGARTHACTYTDPDLVNPSPI